MDVKTIFAAHFTGGVVGPLILAMCEVVSPRVEDFNFREGFGAGGECGGFVSSSHFRIWLVLRFLDEAGLRSALERKNDLIFRFDECRPSVALHDPCDTKSFALVVEVEESSVGFYCVGGFHFFDLAGVAQWQRTQSDLFTPAPQDKL